MPSSIPLFYRILCLWFEPISSGFTVWLTFAKPDLYLNSFIPSTMSVRNPQHDMLFYQLSAAFFYVATSQGILLRYTSDVGVWKIINGCLVGWDVILLYSFWNAVSAQGRSNPAVWRGEDWITVGFTAFIGLSRVALVAGAGLGKTKPAEKTN